MLVWEIKRMVIYFKPFLFIEILFTKGINFFDNVLIGGASMKQLDCHGDERLKQNFLNSPLQFHLLFQKVNQIHFEYLLNR